MPRKKCGPTAIVLRPCFWIALLEEGVALPISSTAHDNWARPAEAMGPGCGAQPSLQAAGRWVIMFL